MINNADHPMHVAKLSIYLKLFRLVLNNMERYLNVEMVFHRLY